MIGNIAQGLASNNPQPILSRISLIVQIAFFVATGSLAIMSYATARKTIFQPLRVEIFKKQLENLSQILALFSGKGEVDLRKDFALDQLIDVNIIRMYDDYARFAFNVDLPRESRPYAPGQCPMSRFVPDPETGNIEDLELLDNYIKPPKLRNNDEKKEESATGASGKKRDAKGWNYKNGEIHIPRACVEKEDEFRRLIDDPLCPKSIVTLLERYLEDVDENIMTVRKVILECAKEMSKHYHSIEDLENSETGWISNQITRKWIEMESTAKLIIDTCRSYFDSDNLFSKRRSVWLSSIKTRRAQPKSGRTS